MTFRPLVYQAITLKDISDGSYKMIGLGEYIETDKAFIVNALT